MASEQKQTPEIASALQASEKAPKCSISEAQEIVAAMADSKMRMNRFKGDIRDLPYDKLIKLMKGEIEELKSAIAGDNLAHVVEEAADCYNYLLAITSRAIDDYRNRNVEIWAPVPNYERYEVSNKGNARGPNGPLSPYTNGNGYKYLDVFGINGTKKSAKMHRLVAEAFIPNPDRLPQVNHIDEDKANNNVSNLEWCTCQQNIEHTFAKTYVFISPDGVETTIHNLTKFCEKNGLQRPNMLKVYKGQRKHCKGWTRYEA